MTLSQVILICVSLGAPGSDPVIHRAALSMPRGAVLEMSLDEGQDARIKACVKTFKAKADLAWIERGGS